MELKKNVTEPLLAAEETAAPAAEKPAEGAAPLRDNPTAGCLWYCLHLVFCTGAMYLVKASLLVSPGISTWQLTFARSIVSCILPILHLRTDSWKILVTSVTSAEAPSLLFRTIVGATSIQLSYYALTMFDVSTCTISLSSQGVFVGIFAYLVLREKLSGFEWASILLALAAVSMVLVGTQYNDSEESVNAAPTAGGYIALLCIPVCGGACDVAMRKMRSLHEIIVSFYVNLGLLIASVVLILVMPANEDEFVGFTFFGDLSLTAWILVIGMGTSNTLSLTIKFAAYQYQEPAKLQVYSFLPRVFQIFVDNLVLGAAFTGLQVGGFAVLAILYGLQVAKYFCKCMADDLPVKKKGG